MQVVLLGELVDSKTPYAAELVRTSGSLWFLIYILRVHEARTGAFTHDFSGFLLDRFLRKVFVDVGLRDISEKGRTPIKTEVFDSVEIEDDEIVMQFPMIVISAWLLTDVVRIDTDPAVVGRSDHFVEALATMRSGISLPAVSAIFDTECIFQSSLLLLLSSVTDPNAR